MFNSPFFFFEMPLLFLALKSQGNRKKKLFFNRKNRITGRISLNHSFFRIPRVELRVLL